LSTTVSAFITELDLRYPNAFTNTNKLAWVNELELSLYTDIIEEYRVAYYSRTAHIQELTLPSGVTFDDVYSVWVDSVQYQKNSLRHYNTLKSFWHENNKLQIYPIPTENDSSYVSGAAEITFAVSTITTTGDDFIGFTAGDIILVSGCSDETANNKYATIVSVAAKVLAFATGTFTAQAESAAVTITAPKVKLIYRYTPTEKVVGNIATDTLLLPGRFNSLYYFYAMAQMALLNREFDEYSNYQTLYNSALADFVRWYEDRRPFKADNVLESGWGYVSSGAEDE